MKRRGALLTVLVLALVAVIVFFYINRPEVQAKELRLGAIIPLTGWAAEFGTHERIAAEVAVRRLQDLHKSWRIQLSVEDTGSEVKNAVTAFTKLTTVGQAPQAILVESSGASLALGPLFDEKQIIMLSISANPEVTKNSTFVFRSFPTSEEEVSKVLDYIVRSTGFRKIGILHLNDEYGLGYLNPFQQGTKQRGLSLSFVESYAPDSKDFRSQIARLIESGSDSVFVVGYGSAMGLLLKQLRESGFRGGVFATSSVIYQDVFSVAPEAIEGTIFADIPYDINASSGEMSWFLQEYRRSSGKDPSPLAAMVYDGLMMIGGALIAAEANPTVARSQILRTGQYRGINNLILTPPSRDLKYSLDMKQVANGRSILLQSSR